MDELVAELHVKPQKRAGMATDGGSARHSLNGGQAPFRMGSNILRFRTPLQSQGKRLVGKTPLDSTRLDPLKAGVIRGCQTGIVTSARSDERIQPALHALLLGDADGLRAALEVDPDVVNITVGGHTLLELTTQPDVSPPSPATVDVLIKAGAALDRALNLAGCWNLPDLCAQILTAGADPAARADAGITPLESAAMHSSTEAADVLVEAGLHRPSLWLAAAAGLLPVVMDWVAADGSLRGDPGPYRPDWADVGRPAGAAPSDDPGEILGEAFVFAALNNRRAVVDYFLEIGVDINSGPYRNTTALHFAIQFRRLDMVQLLLDRGAATTIEDDTHQSDAAGWAQACDNGSEAATAIRELLGDASS